MEEYTLVGVEVCKLVLLQLQVPELVAGVVVLQELAQELDLRPLTS